MSAEGTVDPGKLEKRAQISEEILAVVRARDEQKLEIDAANAAIAEWRAKLRDLMGPYNEALATLERYRKAKMLGPNDVPTGALWPEEDVQTGDAAADVEGVAVGSAN